MTFEQLNGAIILELKERGFAEMSAKFIAHACTDELKELHILPYPLVLKAYMQSIISALTTVMTYYPNIR